MDDTCCITGKHSSVLDRKINNCEVGGLEFSPNELYFGALVAGEVNIASQSITVKNIGKGRVRIIDIRITKGANIFELLYPNSYPEFLEPDQTFDISVAFNIAPIGQIIGLLEVRTNEDRLPYGVGLSGRVVGTNVLTAVYDYFNAKLLEERWAWANALGAEAGYRLTLEASLRDEIEARVMVEYIARVTADEAETSARLLMGVNIRDEVTGVMSEERFLRATADGALGSRIDALELTFDGDFSDVYAAIHDEVNARVNAMEAEANRINSIFLNYSTTNQMNSSISTTVNAAISSVENAYVSAIMAEASRVDNLLLSYTTKNYVDNKVQIDVNAAITSEQSARVSAIAAEASRVDNLLVNYSTTGSTNSAINAAVSAETNARVTASIAEANRVDGLISSFSSSGGNLLTNTEFNGVVSTTPSGWFAFYSQDPIAGGGVNYPDSNYHPIGENTLAVRQNGSSGPTSYMGYISSPVPVKAGDYVEASCYFNAHRAIVGLVIYFRDELNNSIDYTEITPFSTIAGLGNSPSGYIRSGIASVQVPIGAVQAVIELRKYGHEPQYSDSYAWFWRPYFGMSKQGRTTLTPYSVGNGYANYNYTNGRINDEINVRSSADYALASRVNLTEAQFTGTNDSYLFARLRNEESARVDGDSSNALRSSVLEAQMRRETPSEMNTAVNYINGRIATEETVRSNEIAAEVLRVDTLLASYTSTSGMNSAINIATSAEATNRTNAISTAIAAEVVRVNNIIANYSTTGAVNSAISAAVAGEASVRAGADGALSTRVDGVEAVANGASANAGIALSAASDVQTKLASARVELVAGSPGGRARVTLRSDSNNGAGIDIEGDVNFKGKLLVDVGAGPRIAITDTYILSTNGVVMTVTGIGFGSTNQFIKWSGPHMELNQCNEANAISYERVDGSAYFGGSLNAGSMVNPIQTTSLALDAGIRLGPFGSNGGQRVLTATWSRRFVNAGYTSGPTWNGTYPSAILSIYRGIDATGILLAQQTVTGNEAPTIYPAQNGDPGSVVAFVGRSISFTDNTGGTGDQNFFVRAQVQSLFGISGSGSPGPGQNFQTVGLISVEQ